MKPSARRTGLSQCHRSPRDIVHWAGAPVPRMQRYCTLCQAGVIGDEQHLVFECQQLQHIRNKYDYLFRNLQGDTMLLFMWQQDMVSAARFIDECLQLVYTSADPLIEDQASHQP